MNWKDKLLGKKAFQNIITIIILSSITLLALNVFSQTRDGRSQIMDDDGGDEILSVEGELKTEEELRLQAILSKILGVGNTEVMITYNKSDTTVSVFAESEEKQQQEIQGVLVAAEGADNNVVKVKIVDAVAAMYGIGVSNVIVFPLEE